MKKIILASASPQRKSLLKLMGLKFLVRPSRSREINKIRTTCEALVKENALLKAREVAQRSPDAIVIGADTVVYMGGKWLVCKPRDLAHAKKTLKNHFSQAPVGLYRAGSH